MMKQIAKLTSQNVFFTKFRIVVLKLLSLVLRDRNATDHVKLFKLALIHASALFYISRIC